MNDEVSTADDLAPADLLPESQRKLLIAGWAVTLAIMAIWPLCMFAVCGFEIGRWYSIQQVTYTAFHIGVVPTVVGLLIARLHRPLVAAFKFRTPIRSVLLYTLVVFITFVIIQDHLNRKLVPYMMLNVGEVFNAEVDLRAFRMNAIADGVVTEAENEQFTQLRTEYFALLNRKPDGESDSTSKHGTNGMPMINSIISWAVALGAILIFGRLLFLFGTFTSRVVTTSTRRILRPTVAPGSGAQTVDELLWCFAAPIVEILLLMLLLYMWLPMRECADWLETYFLSPPEVQTAIAVNRQMIVAAIFGSVAIAAMALILTALLFLVPDQNRFTGGKLQRMWRWILGLVLAAPVGIAPGLLIVNLVPRPVTEWLFSRMLVAMDDPLFAALWSLGIISFSIGSMILSAKYLRIAEAFDFRCTLALRDGLR